METTEPPPPVTARFRWTAGDLATGRKHATKASSDKRLLYLLAIPVLIASFLLKPSSGRRLNGQSEMIFFLGLAGLFVLTLVLSIAAVWLTRKILARNERRQFEKVPAAQQEIEWHFTSETITVISLLSSSVSQWHAFQKVISTPDGFLFMPDSKIFYFVPLRAFVSPRDIESLKALARLQAREFTEKN